MTDDPALTYTSYLALDEVLAAQRPRSDEHDEMLFIVVHQVYELWFKQLLHELRHAKAELDKSEATQVLHTFKRVLTILKVVVAQIDVLETMTPRQFLGFRSRLESASGFQSKQFRELEALFPELWQALVAYLGAPEDIQAAIVGVYRADDVGAQICERFVDLDEGMQEWRYRHVKMVERTIGTAHGTGGSHGVEYLRTTLSRPVFPDLWAVRDQL
ncbi:MAG TPA: tryptophan 2,3-dioxygenase family protein [Acidimicrobiales bacterium]|nr:tryptophan 2,3-dioxygenase family protein [Acidimicrobiales bacterium]